MPHEGEAVFVLNFTPYYKHYKG